MIKLFRYTFADNIMEKTSLQPSWCHCQIPFHSQGLLLLMMTSSNGNIFRVTGHLCGEFTGPRWIPAQRPVTRSFDVFFWSASEKNGWVNNRKAGDLRRYRIHYDVIVMNMV